MTYTVPLPETKITQESRVRLGEAIYLLAHLIRSVNWETGKGCFTHERIAQETGFPERTIARWMALLIEEGEITTWRAKHGTIVQISDYESIARTRGISYSPPRATKAPKQRAEGEWPEPAGSPVRTTPCAADESATSGEQNLPSAADEDARFGERSIVQILPQVMRRSMFPNAPSRSGEPGEAPDKPRRDQTDKDQIDQPSRAVLTLDQLNAKLDALTEEEYHSIELAAMAELEHDARGFYRMFVTRNEEGELQSTTPAGKHMVMRRMADILDRY